MEYKVIPLSSSHSRVSISFGRLGHFQAVVTNYCLVQLGFHVALHHGVVLATLRCVFLFLGRMQSFSVSLSSEKCRDRVG